MKRIIIYAKVTIISDNNNILLKGRGLKLIILFSFDNPALKVKIPTRNYQSKIQFKKTNYKSSSEKFTNQLTQ